LANDFVLGEIFPNDVSLRKGWCELPPVELESFNASRLQFLLCAPLKVVLAEVLEVFYYLFV